MAKQKRWNMYIMAGNLKFYLIKHLTTSEAINWIKENCKVEDTNYFMCGTQVFCEFK